MSQHYLLPCSCGQRIRVGIAQAGGQVVCTCGKKLRIPTMRGLRELQPAPADTISGVMPRWTLWHGVVFASALLIVLLGGVLVTYHAWRYSSYRFSSLGDLAFDRSADWTKAEVAEVDKLTPVQALAEWNDNLEKGL